MLHKLNQFDRRKRARAPLARQALPAGGRGCPCFRSSKHIYAQVIDDAKGHTLAAASSLEKDAEGPAQDRRRQGGRRRRSASSWPSGPSRPASTRSCSIAAAIAITGASRRWPTARAKAACNF